jgi:hypothetical protein
MNNLEDFSLNGLKDFLEKLCVYWCHDYGYMEYKIREFKNGKFKFKLELHTGGWSDNETIISDLESNFFWFLYWQKSVRGGHYYFGN